MSQAPKVKGLPKRTVMRQGVPDGVGHVLAVHSGKGGVGKTFIAVNLALYLADKGFTVGLLDGDIDCPNVMKCLNLRGKLVANRQKKIVPLEVKREQRGKGGRRTPLRSMRGGGVKVVSMAALQEREDQVFLWRGPVVSRAMEQLLYDTAWGELDFLIVDLPPGTSDIPITLFKMVTSSAPQNSYKERGTGNAAPLRCAVLVVSTPQELALLDAKKSLQLAEQMKVPVAGMIENMAGELFGSGRVEEVAAKAGVPFLGSVPLKREFAVSGTGSGLAFKDLALQKIFSGLLDSVFVQ